MIHEALPRLTETAFGSHPCCVVSVTYVRSHCFHGGNTGSNPVGDANKIKNFRKPAVFLHGPIWSSLRLHKQKLGDRSSCTTFGFSPFALRRVPNVCRK